MELDEVMDGPCCTILCLRRGTGSGITLKKFLKSHGARGTVAAQLLPSRSRGKNATPSPDEWRSVLSDMEAVVTYGINEIADVEGSVKRFSGKNNGLGEFKVRGWRLLFFLDLGLTGARNGTYKDRLVVTTCLSKGNKREQNAEIERCSRLRDQYHKEKYG